MSRSTRAISNQPCVIARVFGGLGNQLFCYAAARRLALANNVALRLDARTGFVHDTYRREYILDRFSISSKEANPWESYRHPVGRARRRAAAMLNRWLPFAQRWYIKEKQVHQFEPRVLTLKIQRPTYLTGYWQSERYFADVEPTVRADLAYRGSHSAESICLAETLDHTSSVSVHMRSYSEVNYASTLHSPVSIEYYVAAARWMAQRVASPTFYCFSDDVEWARRRLSLPWPVVIMDINANRGVDGALDDLWLISQFKYHIVSNSTFSWWGAWLGECEEGLIVAPRRTSQISQDYYPDRWHLV